MGRLINGYIGTVHLALNEVDGGFLHVKVLEGKGRNGAPSRGRVFQEIAKWKSVRHPNILSVMGAAYVGSFIYVHTEVSSLGPLSVLLREFGPLSGHRLRRSTWDLVSAVSHLHSLHHPVVHGNIRAAAVAVEEGHVVLTSDFGGAELSDSRPVAVEGAFRSLPWTAPEVVRRAGNGLVAHIDRFGDRRQADVWSMGCTLIEMATACQPWGSDMSHEELLAILEGSMPVLPAMPTDLVIDGITFVTECMQWDWELRPKATQLLAHPFISEFSD